MFINFKDFLDVCVYVHHMYAGVIRDQKRGSGLLRLAIQALVNDLTWGAELWSSGRATNALNY